MCSDPRLYADHYMETLQAAISLLSVHHCYDYQICSSITINNHEIAKLPGLLYKIQADWVITQLSVLQIPFPGSITLEIFLDVSEELRGYMETGSFDEDFQWNCSKIVNILQLS